jgi:hypothetical protein
LSLSLPILSIGNTVVILGTQITLWCFDLRNNFKFKVIIGDSNDIDDLKEAIKEKCKPLFDGFGSYALILQLMQLKLLLIY